jgi:hypothetical protein
MRITNVVLETSLAASLLVIAGAGCSDTASEEVAYEDAYAGDYYYPADVANADLYGAGWDSGLYLTAPASSPIADVADAGQSGGDGGSGATRARGAVGDAIRNIAAGGTVCPGQATVSRTPATGACGLSGSTLNIVFNGCQLSGGGTVDGTVNVQLNVTGSDTDCTSSTTITGTFTSTITNLTYTGTGGSKIVIPNQMDMATVMVPFGTTPSTVMMTSSGEIQRLGTNGSTTSDRTFTGNRTYSNISITDKTYTVDGMLNVTDKAGGTATITATGLQHEPNCCKPTGGTLSVARTGGSHAGTHSWTFSATCGSATLDGKTVSLPACL